MAAISEKLKVERRRLEDYLRKEVAQLEREGREDDALTLLQAVREFIREELADLG